MESFLWHPYIWGMWTDAYGYVLMDIFIFKGIISQNNTIEEQICRNIKSFHCVVRKHRTKIKQFILKILSE